MGNDLVRVERALLSLSDKSGISGFARSLSERGVEILSTGGTAAAVRSAGLPVIDVEEVTGMMEMMDGKVKTIHPAIHGGLLADVSNPSHALAMERYQIPRIDMVVVTLYPFEATLERRGGTEDCIENIDIGGSALIRAAAKNHQRVVAVTDFEQFGEVIAELNAHEGCTTLPFRQRFASRAFARTAVYDIAVANWAWSEWGQGFAPEFLLGVGRRSKLRYGENPHQKGAVYLARGAGPSAATARKLQGKALSYNNLMDADAAVAIASAFDPAERPACAIVKHGNPCGAALGSSPSEAFQRALVADRTSAFGGVAAFNTDIEEETAESIAGVFLEVVLAPSFGRGARTILQDSKNLRVLETGGLPLADGRDLRVRSVAGGILVQERDHGRIDASGLKVVTSREPSETEIAAMLFAWRVVKHAGSNAVVIAREGETVGIGAGQPSRVGAVKMALAGANANLESAGLRVSPEGPAVLASDAFFPFADSVELAAKAGVRAIIQPGGSIRDEEIIKAVNSAEMAMVFTGMRHFRH